MSLSNRIALGVALVLTLTLTVLGVTMVRATRATLTNEIDERLISSVKRVEGFRDPWDKFKLDGRDVVKAGPAHDERPGEAGESRPVDKGVVISRAPGKANGDGIADLEVVITEPADGERERRDHDTDVFVPDIVGRNVALIIVGPLGNKMEYPSGYKGAPDSLPAQRAAA